MHIEKCLLFCVCVIKTWKTAIHLQEKVNRWKLLHFTHTQSLLKTTREVLWRYHSYTEHMVQKLILCDRTNAIVVHFMCLKQMYKINGAGTCAFVRDDGLNYMCDILNVYWDLFFCFFLIHWVEALSKERSRMWRYYSILTRTYLQHINWDLPTPY